MEAEHLRSILQQYPRVPLGEFPTPLEALPRLSKQTGRQLYIKRDDVIGPGMGGNKTRKLEYLLAEAQQRALRKVVTFGGLQSNHARITAAACIKLGMEPHLFYFERRPEHLVGNLLVNHLLGAQMHFIPFGGGGGGMTIEQTIRLVKVLAWVLLGRHYYIPVGGHTWLGCLGYVQAALEIHQQILDLGLQNAWLVVASGSGGTLAGLISGFALLNSPIQVLGIDVGKLWKGFPASIAHLASEICKRLGEEHPFTARQVPLIEETYAGAAYGIPSKEGCVAIHTLAQLEGIILDPVYTAKAFAGLLDQLGKGRLGTDEPIIFLHTGGVPAVFAFDVLSH